jgi:hypothetical protein
MKVALIHDWLTGMRGGEKCLEVFCELYPEADLYTLVYAPDSVSDTIRRMNVRSSWVNRLPAALPATSTLAIFRASPGRSQSKVLVKARELADLRRVTIESNDRC